MKLLVVGRGGKDFVLGFSRERGSVGISISVSEIDVGFSFFRIVRGDIFVFFSFLFCSICFGSYGELIYYR